MLDAPDHQCAVGAVVDPRRKRNVAPFIGPLLRRLEHRGSGACGSAFIAEQQDSPLQVVHREGRAREVFPELQAHTHSAIFHALYRTNPHSMPHPYITEHRGQRIGVAFNGNIPSTVLEDDARTFLASNDHSCETRSDTELIARLLAVHVADCRGDVMRAFAKLPDHLGDGAYNIVCLTEDGHVYALRDPRGYHPLVLGQTKDGLHALASEDQALRRTWDIAREVDVARVKPGMAVHLGPGVVQPEMEQLFEQHPKHCSFEWAYFADYSATLDGARVERVRRTFGQCLAELDAEDMVKWTRPIVVPVPDSARIAAQGYADASCVRSMDVMVKRPDAMRSFIAPEKREKIIREKFDVDWSLMEGRDVVLIDDSLVRGTTMKTLLEILKNPPTGQLLNARIHLRFAFPPIIAPCFYGIDFSKRSQLLVPRFAKEATPEDDVLSPLLLRTLAQELGAASVKFLPISAVHRAINMPGQENDLCRACFTGEYPTQNTQELYQLQLAQSLQQRKA